ncbi:MAG: NeuD/PglB/VioB family sugar acetyltransferase [Selenomonadaceae bacterium]|nr:NeuD/PglB/VioB family sugar acetyltransferase [Selenomonadaceae bacterium]
MKNLVIIGTGGFAREIYWHAHKAQGFGVDWQIKGFIDGDVKLAAAEYELLPAKVLGDVDDYKICADDVFTCAIGSPKVRRRLSEKILSRGGTFINIISTLAYIMPTVEFGTGVIIAPHTDIGDRAVIGNFVATNAMTIIGHDAHIGDYSCIMPHVAVSGKCQIGAEVFIGSGAVILPKAKVGDGATVGAGSVVLKRVKAGVTVFGNPSVEI